MEKIKWEKKLIAGLSGLCLAATALAISANTTAFAATSEEPLSPDNGYEVVVELSATDSAIVGLQDVSAGDYILAVTPWYTEPEAIPAFEAKLNDSEDFVPLESSVYYYDAYIAGFKISANSTQFEIKTTLTETTTVTVTLYEKVTPEALPTDAAHPVTLARYEVYNYQYDFEGESGYYTVNPHLPEGVGGLDVTLKGDPNDLAGIPTLNATYPVYLEKNKPYYFTVEWDGDPMTSTDTVNVYFSFNEWTFTGIAQDVEFYAPVTPATATHSLISAENLTAGDYVLRTLYVPDVYYRNEITVHVVDSVSEETTAVVEDGECTFTVTATTTDIYFTSNANTAFAMQAYISTAPSPSVDIPLNASTAVSLKANETISCFVKDVTESGNYDIAIQDAEGNALESSPISVSTMYETVLQMGQNSGMFPIVLAYPNEYYPGETSTDAPLYFTNNSDAAITFYVKVTKSAGDYYFTANTEKEITAQPESRVTYFVTGVTSGTYLMKLTDASGNIVIYDYMNRYEPFADKVMPENLYSFGDFTLEGGRTFTYAFIVENTATTEQTFTVEFSKVNSLVLGVETQITVEGAQNYYIGSLLTGRYMLTLSNIPEGADIEILYNGEIIASSVKTVGYFNVEVPEGKFNAIAMLSIINYNAGDVTFTATVTEAPDGDMTLGTAQIVTLDYTDNSKTYNIALDAGRYTLTLNLENVPADITVYVYVDGAYMEFIDNVATFEVATAGTLPVEFTYLYFGEGEYTDTLSFTAVINAVTVEA